MKTRLRIGIGLALAALCGAGGCRTPAPAEKAVVVASGAATRSAPAASQPATGAAARRGLADVLAAALQHNPELIALRQDAEIARAQAVTVSGLRNPELRFGYGEGARMTERSWYTNTAYSAFLPPATNQWAPLNSYRGEALASESWRLTLRLYPPNPWLLRAQGAANRALSEAAGAEARACEWRVTCEVRRHFARLDFIAKELRTVGQLAEIKAVYAGAVRTLAAANQVTAVAELDAEQRHYALLMELEALRRERARVLSELSTVVGGPVGDVAPDAGAEPGLGASPGDIGGDRAAALAAEAVERRGEVVAAYWRHQAALAALRAARGTRAPWFTYLEGSYGRGGGRENVETADALQNGAAGVWPDPVIAVDDTDDEAWSVEAAIEIPIMTLGPGATRVQRADCRRYAGLLAEQTRAVAGQCREAVEGWTEARARLEQVRRLAGAQARKIETLRGTLARTDGLAPEDRLKVDELALQLERTLAQAEQECALAWIRVQETFGAELPATLD
jgi:outer membrane protein TolC